MQNTLKKSIKKIDELYKIAEENGIPIENHVIDNLVSCSYDFGAIKIISMGELPENSGITEQECLAHELGHCMTDSFYRGYSPLELRAKHEHRANKWAIQRLIPFEDLCRAVADGYCEVWQLAEYFDVSCEFIEKTAYYYESHSMDVPKKYY